MDQSSLTDCPMEGDSKVIQAFQNRILSYEHNFGAYEMSKLIAQDYARNLAQLQWHRKQLVQILKTSQASSFSSPDFQI